MKILSIVLIVCIATLTTISTAVAAAETVIIQGGWLFDGVSDGRRRNTGIVIRDGRFAEVGPT